MNDERMRLPRAYQRDGMDDDRSGGQRPPLPKRKYIRLPREAYRNPASSFNITIDALGRQRFFGLPSFNSEVVATLCGLALRYCCPIEIYCLMPTHLHMLVKPGLKSVVELIAEFKKKTSDLARETQGIRQLWQRSFFDHRVRLHESVAEQYEYIRMNPVRAGLVAHPDDWPWTGRVDIG